MTVTPRLTVVAQNGVREAVFFQNTGKNRKKFFVIGPAVRVQAKGDSGVVIEYGQGKTSLPVDHGKVALEVHLPQLVGLGALEMRERCGGDAGLRLYAAITLEDVFDGAFAGKTGVVLVFQAPLELARPPGGVLGSLVENQLFRLGKCLPAA